MNVSKHLTPGGWFVLVDYNPENRRQEDSRSEKRFRYAIADEPHNRILFYWRRSCSIDPEGRYAQVTYAVECVEWHGGGIHVETFPATMTIHYNTAEQLDELLSMHSLKTIRRFGGYRGEPFTLEAESQVVIAERTVE